MPRPRSQNTVLNRVKAAIVFAILENEPSNDPGVTARLYERIGIWCFDKCDQLDAQASERRLSEANQ